MINRALIPPSKISTDVILHWNSMSSLASVPESSFPQERRHVIAALKRMTSQKIPDWDEAFAKIGGAIKNYNDIRGAPTGQYEYVGDKTLSQFLMWELVKFLEVNQPHMRLRKDKTRLPEKIETKEEIEARARRQFAKTYNTSDPVEIDCLRHADKQDIFGRCDECRYGTDDLKCNHPAWPRITPEYMDECCTLKEEQ